MVGTNRPTAICDRLYICILDSCLLHIPSLFQVLEVLSEYFDNASIQYELDHKENKFPATSLQFSNDIVIVP